MPRAFSARKPLERSKRPHNSAVCVNFKFDQASPPSISLLLAQPASSPPSFPLLPKSCIINIYRDVSTTRSKGAFTFVSLFFSFIRFQRYPNESLWIFPFLRFQMF